MHTDERKTRKFEMKMPGLPEIFFRCPNLSRATIAFTISFSLSLSLPVFIRACPWFQRLYPTDASW
jgi:hypothetical protein